MATLTSSGNEITDAIRAAGLVGDGRIAESSFGIYEASQNYASIDDAGTGWLNEGVITHASDSTDVVFGSQECIATITGTTAANLVVNYSAAQLGSPAVGDPRTFSVYMKAVTASVIGKTYIMQIQLLGGAHATASMNANAVMTATGAYRNGYQRFSVTAIWDFADRTSATLRIASANQVNGEQFKVDGVQMEPKGYATPFMGALGSRAAARMQAPVALIDETQSWVAFRIRTDWSTGAAPAQPSLFGWFDNNNNLLRLVYTPATSQWILQRVAGGVTGSDPLTHTETLNGLDTVIAAWDATKLYLSINGSAFTSVASASIPVLAATLFDIGSGEAGANQFGGEMFWAAVGTGTLTDADAAAINAFGSTDKAPEDFNAATAGRAACTATMPFSTATYLDEAFVIIDPDGTGASRGKYPRLRVDADFTNDPTNATRVWTNITSDVRDIGYTRSGRSTELQRTEPGSLSGLLNNRHGKYDSTNTGSPYYPGVKRFRWLRVRARWGVTDYTRWTGLITTWNQMWPGDGKDATVEISGLDAMTVLRLFDLVGLSYGSQRTDQRASSVCASIGIPVTIASTGSSTIDAIGPFPEDSDPLAHLQDVEEHENGLIFAEGDGTITFQDRHYRLLHSGTSVATIGDQAGDLRYRDAELRLDDSDIWNSSRVTTSSGAYTATSTNATSILSYFKRVLRRAQLNTNTAEADSASQYLVQRYGDPDARVPRVELVGAADTSFWPTILAAKNSDRFTWKRRATAHTITTDVFVERVSDRWHPGGPMTVAAELSPATEQYGWVLGDATYGLLGSTTRLPY